MRQHLAPKSQPLAYHNYHNVVIKLTTKKDSKMFGQGYYYCVDCNKWVAWLSKEATNQATELGLIETPKRTTRDDFFGK